MDPSISLSWLIVREERTLVGWEDKGRTLSRVFTKVIKEEAPVDLADYVIGRPFPSRQDLEIDALVPDLELIDLINSLWFGSRVRREYMLGDVLEALRAREKYDLTVVDTIPFYDMKYTVLTLMASDMCLVPLRPTLIDTYRTGMMLRQLPKVTGLDERELYPKLGLVFNMVKTSRQERSLERYRAYLLDNSDSRVKIFESHLPHKIGFSRIGTAEEGRGDRESVKEAFSPFFEELASWLGI